MGVDREVFFSKEGDYYIDDTGIRQFVKFLGDKVIYSFRWSV